MSGVAARLVVVAAHPDDETVGAASLLFRAGASSVVHLTDGAPRDPAARPVGWVDRASYARRRREEALAALADAGLAPDRVVCLGAVDQELVDVLAPVARELAAILARLEPRFVVTHPLEGGHPDHDAAAVAVRAALSILSRAGEEVPRLAEMTSYHLAGGRLVTGEFLPGPPSIRHRLTAAERERKRRMLDRYASQAEVLAAFGVEEERFRLAPPVSLSAAPHRPPLHYEVRGWSSFQRFQEQVLRGLASLGLAADGAAALGVDGAP